ncbi:MAG: hypothetical protein V9H26_14305 [Verrucomicrobiota bacterium]
MKIPTPATVASPTRKNPSFDLLTARAPKPIRISSPIIAARPIFRGDKSYLRALRAAEMEVWNARIKFPTFITLLFAIVNAVAK